MSRKPVSKNTIDRTKEYSFGEALIKGLTEAVAWKRGELALENAIDGRAIKAQLRREKLLGVETARADYLPGALVNRLLAGESAIRIWREHRGMTLTALAKKVGISTSYLSRIENGHKPGGTDTRRAIARALRVPMKDLA
ncbi:MAG: helix-turn-helix transcriptional regulator [Methylobacterium sp.]|nr:helix-turn-helix transcriptional regulator [Roseomonas sp.]MCA3297402.1 helix-turn-helix transcriptional regulator [Roseomonas sp.]MCA3650487.1 helix-turn-helix transcriptional regulator [Methylobacterium sp.]